MEQNKRETFFLQTGSKQSTDMVFLPFWFRHSIFSWFHFVAKKSLHFQFPDKERKGGIWVSKCLKNH